MKKKLIKGLWAISYLRNYRYLCCMNKISLQINTQKNRRSALPSSNIAYDAMSDHGMQALSEVLCVYATAVERPVCRLV